MFQWELNWEKMPKEVTSACRVELQERERSAVYFRVWLD